MGNFKRNNKGSSGGSYRGGFGGGKKFGGERGGGKPTMHQATCSKCGDSCEIPFRPTGNRPVFCSKCFDKQGGGSRDGARQSSFDGRRERLSFGSDKQMFDVVCDKCGKETQVPFRPTAGKPVLCRDCFKPAGGGSDMGEITKQIKLLNEKVDKLLKVLVPKAVTFEEVGPTVENVAKKESKKEEKKEKKDKTKEIKKESKKDKKVVVAKKAVKTVKAKKEKSVKKAKKK